MAVESKPLPDIAESAFQFLKDPSPQAIERLAQQTIAVMGLTTTDGWSVDFAKKIVSRTV